MNRPDEPRMKVVKVPMRDTGIGREMGYADDAEFLTAAAAQREEALSLLTPETRQRISWAEERALIRRQLRDTARREER